MGIGALCAFVALVLLRLIGLFTNLFYFGKWSTTMVSPASNRLGVYSVLVPIAGALIIGVMARYGSERIRGHGIPEAIEAILINGSRVEPKVALLKPISSAISIGSGGPFGAEGPIIMTGGAFGSMIAQLFHLTSAERKTLLVAGAAGGMSATFASPVAAVLLAVELLLFEWKPRSLIPVALASAVAAVVRRYILGFGPLFPVPAHALFIGPKGLLGCAFVGLLAGVLSVLLTLSVYAAEDSFQKLRIHWMWWPAIGGLAIGLGGLVFPQALGVGYDTIGSLLQGGVTTKVILGVLLVKWFIWAVSLGSGTSGGVLAPLLMMGGALGGLEAMLLPNEGAGFWPLISMGAILGGRFQKQPIYEALAHQDGIHLPAAERRQQDGRRQVPQAMRKATEVLKAELTAGKALEKSESSEFHAWPVCDERGVIGVISLKNLQRANSEGSGEKQLSDILDQDEFPHVHEDHSLHLALDRMGVSQLDLLPVVSRANVHHLEGVVTLQDVLALYGVGSKKS